MRSLVARLLVLFLAAVPAVWGTCPSWVRDDTADAATSTAKRACPCCAEEPRPESKGPFDRRHRGCDGCPVVDVRHACAQAPTTEGLPPPALLAVLPAVRVEVPALARVRVAVVRADDPGGPPPCVRTVVLLI